MNNYSRIAAQVMNMGSHHSIQMEIVKRVSDDVLIHVNEPAAHAVNTTPEMMIGRPSSDFYPEFAEFAKDDKDILCSGIPKIGYGEKFTDKSGMEHMLVTHKWPAIIDGEGYIGISFIDVFELNRHVNSEIEFGQAMKSFSDVQSLRSKTGELIRSLYEETERVK